MQIFRKGSVEKRNSILKSLYVESGVSSDGAGLFSVNVEQFGTQLLVAVNRLSSDEAGIESVKCQLVYLSS